MNATRLCRLLPRPTPKNPIGRHRSQHYCGHNNTHACSYLLSPKNQTRHFSEAAVPHPVHSKPEGGGEGTTAAYRLSQEEIEWQQRCQLAACYRVSYLQGWHENIFNHITLKVHNSDNVPDGPHFFINEFGVGFDEMNASSILKVNLDGDVVVGESGNNNNSNPTTTAAGRVFKPGYVIHSAIHRGRPDTHAVWHVHPLDTTAVCQTKFGLLPISQEASLAAKRGLSYHPFEGTANSIDERERLVRNLGPTNQILMLENHGPLVASPTLHQAFAGMFFLTRACTFQIKALSSVGGDLSKIHMPSQDLEEEMLARSKRFDEAPKEGVQHDSDKLMFEYAVRAAEQAFGKENIYR